MKVYSPLSGITTNQSEGFNTILKQFQQWKEVLIDLLVLGLYRLQVYYYNEVQRGYCGFGEYTLRSQFASLSRPPDELLLQQVFTPNEILSTVQQSDNDMLINGDKTESPVETLVQTNMDNPEASELVDDTTVSSECTLDVATDPNASQISRARYVYTVFYINFTWHVKLFGVNVENINFRSIIGAGKICHNEKLGVFTVEGTGGNAHCVRIFPKESCTCPSTSRCYHIMAVRMSIGLDKPDDKPKKINLSLLRKNTRSIKDKTSGRKVPRIEVIPAPDSIFEVRYICARGIRS